ncbi:hypothetical protein PFICI_08402 [Pestalotiopsis fici W106-1]|uniref:Uncharacterized protein n=1 Tax=Pestalotiopsis fici (strain W106-1 / CGMCC3.15140) TaxID=1229662 RepID=W3X407_PESFW|nr:uncharacterized protein PFICI_08402 [Pestalotiopsis fici W106-1]ETS80873.1 hypothetical protein PFICI_08402 [Pestalotiopsis fici W106-1]
MNFTRSVIVTGGTQHLGYHAALSIAQAHPEYLVVIASRSARADAANTINRTLNQQNTRFIPLDLSSLDKVKDFAQKWASSGHAPIQALVLNAGIQHPYELHLTEDGLEETFAVNHVGHALLFHLLYPHLAQGARIVLTSSGTHDPAQKSGVTDAKYETAEQLAHPAGSDLKYPGRGRYSTSKLVNVLWTYALHRRLQVNMPEKSITVNAFDPGLMPGTGLSREATRFERFLWHKIMPNIIPLLRRVFTPNVHTTEESGQALARLAIGIDVAGVSGKYFEGLKQISSSIDSYDEKKQEDIWSWTINYLGKWGPVSF